MMFKLFPSKPTLNNDVTVILRGVGERTEAACLRILQSQIAKRNVHLIHESPFSKALLESLKIGVKSRRKWTLVVDADVLLRTGIVQDIYQRAEDAPEVVFAIQTEMLDKFFGGTRVGGIKMYRTHLLPKAMDLIPEVDVRPETYIIKHMHKAGHYVDISALVCGIHDYEQNFEDIFRKGFTHALKHTTLTNSLLPYWRRMSKQDEDFKALLAGYDIASGYKQELKLDRDEVGDEFRNWLKATGAAEKPSLKDDSITQETVDSIMKEHKNPREYAKVRAAIEKLGRPTIPNNP